MEYIEKYKPKQLHYAEESGSGTPEFWEMHLGKTRKIKQQETVST